MNDWVFNERLIAWVVAKLDDAPENSEAERHAAGLILSLALPVPRDAYMRAREAVRR